MAARDPLYVHAEATPDKLALIEDRPGAEVVRRTWSEFAGEVSRLARVLQERGVARGDKIAWGGMN